MKASHVDEKVKIFLLGMVTALLTIIALRPDGSQSLHASDGYGMGAGADGVFALTGPENATLFLVDTNNKQIAQYSMEPGHFSLRRARHYAQDLKIYDDGQKGGITVKKAEELSRAKIRR